MSSFNAYLKEQLKDPAVKAEYDALEPEFSIIQAMIDARKASGLTQKQLAEKTGIAQADISKLENGNANLFAAHSPAFGRGHGHTYLAGICAQCVTYFHAQQYDK